MTKLGQGAVTTDTILAAVKEFGSPLYLYDEKTIVEKCQQVQNMPHAFGLTVRYAMKANSSKALLQLIERQGLFFDVSTLNEARRAHFAGTPYSKMMLTTQEVPQENDRTDLEKMILSGLKYNVCSLRQLELIANFANKNRKDRLIGQ